ncbi:MAG: tRNA 2-thiouridine(34) synthase MnmA [Bacteroidota bacterium]
MTGRSRPGADPARGRVVVAMSGGVDSSVAAGILASQGRDVVGVTIKTHPGEGGGDGPEHGCCTLDGVNDARMAAAAIGIPHYVLDFSAKFESAVIGDFLREYRAGRTPNPCVVCNRAIKWELLLEKAAHLGAGWIATGHYARVVCARATGRYHVARPADRAKDQSYALWALDQESLARTLFPLGDLTKGQVRKTAASWGLPNSDRPESFELCFIPDDDYERFLRERTGPEGIPEGDILRGGRVVGRHRGIPFYTVGQRRHLGLSGPTPLYVTSLDAGSNTVTVGSGEELLRGGLRADSLNMQKYPDLGEGRRLLAMIRYRDEGARALVTQDGPGRVLVRFEEKRRAVTPGQSVVFYEGGDCVGGAVIREVLEQEETGGIA